MKEIKFRVWNKRDKEFLEAEPIYGFFARIDIDDLSEFDIKFGKGFSEIQMYTGIKDKNGVDIYERDIIKIDLIEYNCEVYFGSAEFNIKGKDGLVIGLGSIHHKIIEVVGNIYENPKLLK